MRTKTTGEYLDSSTKTIRRLIKHGLPYYRLPNGTLMFHQGEIDEWVRKSDPRKRLSLIVDSVIAEVTR